MSIFTSIIGAVSKVATTAYGIIKTALPILEALRPAVDEVDEAFVYIENQIAAGGVAADDFLDRNIDAIQKLESMSARGAVLFSQLNGIAAKLRIYSQEQTPDTITEEEAIALGEAFLQIRQTIKGWSAEVDEAIVALKSVHD